MTYLEEVRDVRSRTGPNLLGYGFLVGESLIFNGDFHGNSVA
jgi:hypothetical protein